MLVLATLQMLPCLEKVALCSRGSVLWATPRVGLSIGVRSSIVLNKMVSVAATVTVVKEVLARWIRSVHLCPQSITNHKFPFSLVPE